MKNINSKNRQLQSAICDLPNHELVVGLEIHVELCTKSKMFCKCSADHFEKDPNSQTCPVCLGLPGALPVPNQKAIEWTIMIANALNCSIRNTFKFDRKHYFYLDLPKGFQISQYDQPVGNDGFLEINGKKYRIERVHLEEDTAKLNRYQEETLIDFNRSGVPLVEIVSKPDFRDSETVKQFLEELYWTVKYLGVSNADMEKGNMRLEPNISVRKVGETSLPKYKVELKNINSFKYVKDAIDYEFKRQVVLLEKGETPKQETRGYDSKKKETYPQRSKESASDYRYFPEPDIPPIELSDAEIDSIVCQMPELPKERMQRYVNDCGVSDQSADRFVKDDSMASLFEILYAKAEKSELTKTHNWSQLIANAIINKKIDLTLSPDLIIKQLIESNLNNVNSDVAHELINAVYNSNKTSIEQQLNELNQLKVIGDNIKFDKQLTKYINAWIGPVRREFEQKKEKFDFTLVQNEIKKWFNN